MHVFSRKPLPLITPLKGDTSERLKASTPVGHIAHDAAAAAAIAQLGAGRDGGAAGVAVGAGQDGRAGADLGTEVFPQNTCHPKLRRGIFSKYPIARGECSIQFLNCALNHRFNSPWPLI